MFRLRHVTLIIAAALLAACTSPTSTSSPEPDPTATPEPSALVSLEPTEEPTPSPEPTDEPSATPIETPTPTGGGFEVAANPEADALFLTRDDCENRRDGYRLAFPDDWYTNTEYRNYPPCVWFSPTFYETDGDAVPPEIAITAEWFAGSTGRTDADIVSTEEGEVGGQPAFRTEWDDDVYTYAIQLGRTFEEGPTLLFTTSAAMGGDYELNKAVLDRMLTTIEFIGSTQ